MPIAAGMYYFAHEEDLEDRPPILLLHGAGGSHLNWPPQLRRLPGQRIYALDLPGHGKSNDVGRQAISEYSNAVYKFMKALHLFKAIIVGFSMGSAVAITLALQYRKRVAALCLIGSGAKLRVSPALLEMAANPSMFKDTVVEVIENSYSAEADSQLKQLAIQQMAEGRPATLYGDFLACDTFNEMDQVDKINVPTLLICGSTDRMTPPNRSEYLRDVIKGARLHIIDGAGHMVMSERPDAVAGLLGVFLDEVLT